MVHPLFVDSLTDALGPFLVPGVLFVLGLLFYAALVLLRRLFPSEDGSG